MSKRSSVGTPNTLFNYFGKSPQSSASKSTPKTGKSTPTTTKKFKNDEDTPKTSKKSLKRELEDRDEPAEKTDSDEENEKAGSMKKRRRILMESDCDQENENTNGKPVIKKEKVEDTKKVTVKKEVKNEVKKEVKNEVKKEVKNEVKKEVKKTSVKKKNEQEDTSSSDDKKEVSSDEENKEVSYNLTSEEVQKKVQESIKQLLENPSSSTISEKKREKIADKSEEPFQWPHQKLEFLQPNKIMDIKRRRPDHPDYDPTTLYVPEKFLSNLSPGVRQWWDIKAKDFDCVIFFKVGKFYELYHMDADVGVKELGFTYMKGEFAHSGFPEISYDKMVTVLVARGYKVARVEQTETPDMMTERCKKTKNLTKFDRVVRREVCQIMNMGTQVFGSQNEITYKHEPHYMLSLSEKDEGLTSKYGICFVDTSIGDFHVGQFDDDKNSSRLLTLLSHYPPVLILYEKPIISIRTQQIMKTILCRTLKENLKKFWNGEKTLKCLAENYYSKEGTGKWPEVIQIMQDEGDHLGLTPKENYKLALSAFGACISYLKRCLLDKQILSMARYHLYIPQDILDTSITLESASKSINQKLEKIQKNRHMILDGITLRNLRVTDKTCSLVNTLDNCSTKFGKRLLYSWICSPSCELDVIKERQNAISEFLSNNDVLQQIQKLFHKLPDFERSLAQIHGFGTKKKLEGHPDGRAIFFEEKIYNKKKIRNFINVLKGFKSLLEIPKMFEDFNSELISRLTQLEPNGQYPDLAELLEFFDNAFDHAEALKEGVIAPEKGVDSEYDAVQEGIEEINEELKEYLKEQEKLFGCRITYFGSDKKRYQLEIPEKYSKTAGKEYSFEGQKKGSNPARRFHTEETKNFLKRMICAEEDRNAVLRDLSRRIFEKFADHYDTWQKCVNSIGILDVLGSLAEYARNQNVICIPEVVESDEPFIEIEEGYHPCLNPDTYIPNGINLGCNNEPPFVLLTGPNMGGKSTFMREIALLAIMSQIGCHVPAKSCKLSLIDRIFTRLGAQDDILAGHSTFLVELNETAAIMKHSTLHSLILLDELGRGTATYDGTAIAGAVANYLADRKSRTLFSTHYHNLVDGFLEDKRMSFGHMACMVENEGSDTDEVVTFLYKYTSGVSPKSYGFNVAKLGGMPLHIVKRARQLAKEVELEVLKEQFVKKVLNKATISEMKSLIRNIQ